MTTINNSTTDKKKKQQKNLTIILGSQDNFCSLANYIMGLMGYNDKVIFTIFKLIKKTICIYILAYISTLDTRTKFVIMVI